MLGTEENDRSKNESGAEGNVDWALLLLILAFTEGDPEKAKALIEMKLKEVDDGKG